MPETDDETWGVGPANWRHRSKIAADPPERNERGFLTEITTGLSSGIDLSRTLFGRPEESPDMTVHLWNLTLDWLGYATTRIEWTDGPIAYTDPGRYGVLTGEWTPETASLATAHPPARDYRRQDADLVVVTHDHHYDGDGIMRVATEETSVVVFEGVEPERITRDEPPLTDLPGTLIRVEYGDTVQCAGIDVTTIEARTTPSEQGAESSHPPGFGCGYLLGYNESTVFYPGDSDRLQSHSDLDVDVFLAPIDDEITMGPDGATTLASALAPSLVVPIHYNTFPGLAGNSEAFATGIASRSIPVALDETTDGLAN